MMQCCSPCNVDHTLEHEVTKSTVVSIDGIAIDVEAAASDDSRIALDPSAPHAAYELKEQTTYELDDQFEGVERVDVKPGHSVSSLNKASDSQSKFSTIRSLVSSKKKVSDMHSVYFLHRYGKSLWMLVQSLPIIAICLIWAILTDHSCEDGRRNLQWYQWCYDFTYTIFGVLTCISVFDVCCLSTGCSNWNCSFKFKFWIPSIAVGILTCVGLNIFATHVDVHTSDVSWLFGKSIVIFASTAAAFTMLFCALWHTVGWQERIFAVKSWTLIFIFALWALGFYILNQLYVLGYIHLQKKVCDAFDSAWGWNSLYDYSAATFFTSVYVKVATHAGHWIMSIVRETAPPLQKDRLYFLVVLWSNLFGTVFSRVIFKEVQDNSVVLILMVKDSLVHVMDLTLKYNPTRMVRLAIRKEADDASWTVCVAERALGLLLDVDLRLTLEFFFGFRSHSHHSHHMPDESYTSEKVKEVIQSHQQHISRAQWRISHVEATPEIQASLAEDPDNAYPAGTLHWSGAMRRWKEHAHLLEKNPNEFTTSLHPDLRAIQWCERDSQEGQEDESHELHCMYWWHHFFCRAGLTRSEIKSYLAWVWNCKEWTVDREYEAEAICDRMCFVQRNIRLLFVASYMPKIISSIFSVSFIAARSQFPCTLEAYGLDAKPTTREIMIWCYLLCADMIEVVIISCSHWRHKLFQEGDVGWIFVSHVLWDRTFMATVVFVCIHIVQDALIATYQLDF
mmetsp:Transcript_44623/g.83132  ORF Transcript_44623/g.83132 Transcript_44623/m.83132 type:complete len:734 (+) Transcript_44623:105-2306(+)